MKSILTAMMAALLCTSIGCSWFQKRNNNTPTGAGAPTISNSAEPPLLPASAQMPVSRSTVDPNSITETNYRDRLVDLEREQRDNREMMNRKPQGSR